MQVVYHDEDEKMTLYIQAVHTDQQLDWIRDLKKGLCSVFFVTLCTGVYLEGGANRRPPSPKLSKR